MNEPNLPIDYVLSKLRECCEKSGFLVIRQGVDHLLTENARLTEENVKLKKCLHDGLDIGIFW